MKIRQMLVNANKYNIKCPYEMSAKFIVVHNTANDASANNEIQYMITNNNQVSFHVAVDDVETVQGIPFNRNAWHAGDGGNGNGNRNGIAIEICYSKSGGERFNKAEINATKLVAQLLKERGWGIDKVKKHQDFSGKYCPHRTLDLGWTRFLNMVQAELNELNKPSTPSTGLPKGVEPYNGYVEVTYGGADGIDLHSKPTFSGSVSGNAKKGTVLTILGRIKVSGVYMYYTKAGHYITSAKEYVSFRTTLHGTASKPQTPPKPKADQLLYVGSIVTGARPFRVTNIDVKNQLVGSTQLTGKVNKPYHWLPTAPLTVVDSKGNKVADQMFYVGKVQYGMLTGEYKVLAVDVPSDSAKIRVGGKDVWILCKELYEVRDK